MGWGVWRGRVVVVACAGEWRCASDPTHLALLPQVTSEGRKARIGSRNIGQTGRKLARFHGRSRTGGRVGQSMELLELSCGSSHAVRGPHFRRVRREPQLGHQECRALCRRNLRCARRVHAGARLVPHDGARHAINGAAAAPHTERELHVCRARALRRAPRWPRPLPDTERQAEVTVEFEPKRRVDSEAATGHECQRLVLVEALPHQRAAQVRGCRDVLEWIQTPVEPAIPQALRGRVGEQRHSDDVGVSREGGEQRGEPSLLDHARGVEEHDRARSPRVKLAQPPEAVGKVSAEAVEVVASGRRSESGSWRGDGGGGGGGRSHPSTAALAVLSPTPAPAGNRTNSICTGLADSSSSQSSLLSTTRSCGFVLTTSTRSSESQL